MITNADVYTDLQGLTELRASAKADPKSADTLKKVASQFEALFTQMMLKSMRDATPTDDDVFGSSEGKFYRDLYDQQISILLSERQGLGLADMLVHQLGGRQAGTTAAATATAGTTDTKTSGAPETPDAFVNELWPHAQAAAKKLGVAPEALLSQAALETGWGRATIRRADGSPSYNVFGIKADSRWQGDTATTSTLEYGDGVARRTQQTFRAYSSYGEAFADYAQFLQSNPRYGEALQRTSDVKSFVSALARAGYATDPAYAQKIQGILDGQPLREALAGLKSAGDPPLTT
jgi:flagellar protein FlgJ